jgi:hypothetical protein
VSFQFHDDKEDDSFGVLIDGDAKQILEELKDMLELDDIWPIIPLAIEKLYHLCKVHKNYKERLRKVILASKDKNEYSEVFDIEQLRVDAKILEIKGLEPIS